MLTLTCSSVAPCDFGVCECVCICVCSRASGIECTPAYMFSQKTKENLTRPKYQLCCSTAVGGDNGDCGS